MLRGTTGELDFLLPLMLSGTITKPDSIIVSPPVLKSRVFDYFDANGLGKPYVTSYFGECDLKKTLFSRFGFAGKLVFHLIYSFSAMAMLVKKLIAYRGVVVLGWDSRPSDVVLERISAQLLFIPTSIDSTRERFDISPGQDFERAGFNKNKTLLFYPELSDQYSLRLLECRGFNLQPLPRVLLGKVCTKLSLAQGVVALKAAEANQRCLVIALSAVNWAKEEDIGGILNEFVQDVIDAASENFEVTHLEIVMHPRHSSRVKRKLVECLAGFSFSLHEGSFISSIRYRRSERYLTVIGPTGVRGWLDLLQQPYFIYVPSWWNTYNERAKIYQARYDFLRGLKNGAANKKQLCGKIRIENGK